MEFVYLLINGNDWEDMVIILSEEEAIQITIKDPKIRVEIFRKNTDFGYSPTYNYYKSGQLLCNK